MNDAGLQLLRSIEALMRELVGEMRRYSNVTEALVRQRSQNAERQARYRTRTENNVIVTPSDPSVTVTLRDGSLKDLDLEILKDPQRNVTPTSPHRELVVYGTAAFGKAIGAEYPFEKQDAKHIENLLKNHTLTVAKRVVDLACERFVREPFHAARGLSFKLIYTEAAQLLTAKPAGAVATQDNGGAAARKEAVRTKRELAKLEEIKGVPPPANWQEMFGKIGNGK